MFFYFCGIYVIGTSSTLFESLRICWWSNNMKKVLLVLACIFLAQADYFLAQRLNRSVVKFYDFSLAGVTNWAIKTFLLWIILSFFVHFVYMQQSKRDKAISVGLTALLVTFLVPIIMSFSQAMFFGKGPVGKSFLSLIDKVTLTKWAILAHFIVSLCLSAVGFIYVFYLSKKEVKT